MSLSKLRQLLHWGPLLALSVIFYITVVCYHCIRLWFPPWQDLPSTLHATVYFYWLFAILYNFFMAAFLGPGFIKEGWTPERSEDRHKLQFCSVCKGYKAPRSHHCRKCRRCVMKMDHHCPWINTCCGHLNHTRFIYFLFYCILGCSHACIALACSMYRGFYMPYYLYRRHLLEYENVPIVHISVTAFILSLFAFGLAFGVIVSVFVLLYIQLKSVLLNQTGIEQWIVEKAKHRHASLGQDYVYPYALGWRRNWSEVINWKGRPVGDGFTWSVVEGESQFAITLEQKAQKEVKRQHQSECEVVVRYGGSWFPVTFGVCTCARIPLTDEPRLPLAKGERINVTRFRKYWLYGTKKDGLGGGEGYKGWFPRSCVVEVQGDGPHQDQHQTKIKTS